MGWLAIMQLTSHSQTSGVNAQLLLRSASYEKSEHFHKLQGRLCVLTVHICRSLRLSGIMMQKTQGATPAEDAQTSGTGLAEAQQRLRRMVLDSVPKFPPQLRQGAR
jgi:hypothetical protein